MRKEFQYLKALASLAGGFLLNIVQGSKFKVQGWFRVQSSGFRVLEGTRNKQP